MSLIVVCFHSRCRLRIPLSRAFIREELKFCSERCFNDWKKEVETQPHQIYRPRFISIEKLMKRRPANMLQFMETRGELPLHHHD